MVTCSMHSQGPLGVESWWVGVKGCDGKKTNCLEITWALRQVHSCMPRAGASFLPQLLLLPCISLPFLLLFLLQSPLLFFHFFLHSPELCHLQQHEACNVACRERVCLLRVALGCWTATSILVACAHLFQSNELQPSVQLQFGCLFVHS